MSETIYKPITSHLPNEETRTVGLRDLIFRYLKYLPWFIICGILALVGAYVKIRYSIPVYRVQSSLLINNDRSAGGKDDQKLGELFMFEPSINLSNEIEILKSRPVIKRVVRDLGLQTYYYSKGNIRSTLLYGDIPFQLVILDQPNSFAGFGFLVNITDDEKFRLNDSKTVYYFNRPFIWGNVSCLLIRNKKISTSYFGSNKFLAGWQTEENAAGGLISSLKIAPVNDNSTILSISLETENTNVGLDVLNKLMAVYDTIIVEDKNRIAFNSLRFIDERLGALKDSLGEVENGLRNFLERNQAFDIEGQSKNYMNDLGENGKKIMEQEVRVKIVNWLIDYIGDLKNYHNIVPTNLGIEEPALVQMIAAYNRAQLEREANLKTAQPDNPLIRSLDGTIEKLRQDMYQALLNVKHSYLIARENFQQQDAQIRGKLQSLPGKSMKGLNIDRQQKILEELYSFLLKKRLETSISSASTISNSKVVESAIGSGLPVKPDHKSIYIAYLMIGLIIPTSIVALLEMLNDKVNGRIDIEKSTNAPILGEIGHSEEEETLVVMRNSRRFIAEQFRIIRTNLQYVLGKNENPTILITSSYSGEGKSFISTNIGAVMALAGKKTVIMEFDIRKPKIVSGLDLKRKTGITNYIIGKTNFNDLLISVDEIENLYVIPCGPIPPNPAELLLDPRLQELMAEVKKHFDVVIMDTAPIGLVSDAVTLSQYADCTLFIVRRGYTIKRVLGLIEEMYANKKMPSLSILLNDVKTGGAYYGGYYGGYGHYGYGHTHNPGDYFEKERKSSKKLGPSRRLWHWLTRWIS